MSNYEDAPKVEKIGMSFRKSRGRITCDCGDLIKKGTIYSREVFKVDGEIQVQIVANHSHSYDYSEY